MGWFKNGKEVQQGCIVPPYLTSMQYISCKMFGWMNHKLESIDGKNINKSQIADDRTLMAEFEEKLKRLFFGCWF